MQEINIVDKNPEPTTPSRYCLVEDKYGDSYICPAERKNEAYDFFEATNHDYGFDYPDFLEIVEGELTFSLPLAEKIGEKDLFPKRFEDEIGKIASSLWMISSIRNQIMRYSEVSKTIKEGILRFYHKEITKK